MHGLMGLALLAPTLPLVRGHGAVVNPPPRQAVDKDLLPWSGKVPRSFPNVESRTGWCPVPGSADGKPSGQNGQACFWFSNGCSVGCDACDGSSRGPIPGAGGGNATNPPTGIGRNKVGPNGVVCNRSNGVQPTMCDPKHRTVNTDAECGGPEDWYFYSPWRAPGAAPVMDPCGVAGGHRPPSGAFGGIYVNTSHAKLGDFGSKTLPPAPSGTSWKAGSVVEVSWSIEANHAGGYQYRLAPKTAEPPTEALFQRLPLAFVGKQGIRWGGGPKYGGTELFFNATYVTTGTWPEGSAWAQNPIPLVSGDDGLPDFPGTRGKPCFPPKCEDVPRCSHHGDASQGSFEIVDFLRIPPTLPAGEYVLGWRWDCEQSNQTWQSCSDVTVTSK